MRAPRPLLAAVLAAAAATPLALWQTAGEDAAARPGARGFTAVSLTNCGEWAKAGERQRLELVSQMGDHFGHASHIWGGAKLETSRALEVFDRACGERDFRDVKLYKIYARALAFSGYDR